MKLATFAVLTIVLSASSAFAGAGAPVPEKPEGGPPSGRPGAILDDAKCEAVWSMTQREGDTLSEGKAAPFIVNFKMVDTNNDGKITHDEFKEGCKKGLVQEQASRPTGATGGGQTPEQPTKP
jgi:EF hand domain-containing protein